MKINVAKKHLVASCIGILSVLSVSSFAQASSYTLSNIGALTSGTTSYATAINNAGEVVIISRAASGSSHVAVWNSGTVTDLTTLGGNAYASSINSSGQIAGYSTTASGLQQAVVWDSSGTLTNLGNGTTNSNATAINDAGVVVGGSIVWAGGSATNINSSISGASSSYISAISDNTMYVVATVSSGTLPASGTATVNGTTYNVVYTDSAKASAYTQGIAVAANSSGQVAGNYGPWAVTWSGLSSSSATRLPGYMYTTAKAINSSGVIVGGIWTDPFSASSVEHATVWVNGVWVDLNSYLTADEVSAGWVLTQANGINDSGTIVGDATLNGVATAFMLTLAVPEPSSWLMLLGGLGVLSLRTRCRRVISA